MCDPFSGCAPLFQFSKDDGRREAAVDRDQIGTSGKARMTATESKVSRPEILIRESNARNRTVGHLFRVDLDFPFGSIVNSSFEDRYGAE